MKEETIIANNIGMVEDAITDIRALLDTMMYGEGSEFLSEESFNHLRAAYDKVCEANDLLAKV